MQTLMIRRAGRIALKSILAVATSLAIDRIEARRRAPANAPLVTRLPEHVATFDPDLAHDSARITRRIISLAARLEHDLDDFCSLEARLRRAICRVEAVTDQSVSDEEFADLAEWLGIMRVRPALEQLTTAHPDLGRRTTPTAFSQERFPAA
jgi:hypothetical protein